jgi:DNA-binding SARP family transcriptional activator/predicted ATPase
MSHLSLALLGTPEVRYAGRIVKFRTRKEQALLIYLAVEGGLHSREKITALFWPDSDEPQGRTSLRRTLADLRRTLEDAGGATHLIIERDLLGFDFSSDNDLDLHTLESAYLLARRSSPVQEAQGAAQNHLLLHLQRAASLNRGPFLEGFSLSEAPNFDTWIGLQREVWHQRMSLILDQLSQLLSDAGEFHGAMETLARWITLDPLHESAHRRLIEVHLAAGDRHAALRAYDVYRLRLAEELHAKPSAEIEALLASTYAGLLGRHDQKVGPVSPVHFSARVGVENPRELAGPLVGRASEYTRLIEAYRASEHGQAQAVLLQGEAGIGKTRLAMDFLAWAGAQGADVLQGRAFEAGGRLPYQPLVEALRSRIDHENAPDDLLSDPWLAELSRLLPELRDRYPDLAAPTGDETAARIRLFEAVVRLGQALAERAPLVLFLDDIQWADAASLDVLHYAGRRWVESKTPVLLLLSLRTETLATTGTLSRWLAGMEHDVRRTNVTLEAFTFEETLQLIRAQGITNDEALGHWLFAETGGRPFYLMETLKALLERGVLRPRRQVDGSRIIEFEAGPASVQTLHHFLPPGVREVIRSRLDQVTPIGFGLLAAGAVLGRTFTFEQACQVAGLGEDEGLPALDEVVKKRLLQEATREPEEQVMASAATYFFTHDKIRDVVYSQAGEARRRIFHRRALQGLQAAGVHAGELARHALAAGLPEPAFHLSLAAGESAMQLFAVRDAIAFYEQARRLLAEWQGKKKALPALAVSALQHLYTQLGRAYEFTSELESARAVYEAMLELSQELGTPTMECTALNRLATLAVHQHINFERAKALLHQALQVAERSKDVTGLGETEWNIAQLSFYQLEVPSVIAHGERALQLARQLGQPELIARSLNVLASGKKETGYWTEGEADAEEALALYRHLGNRAMEADCLCLLASILLNTGRTQEGIRAAQAARAISLEVENAWGQANGLYHLAVGAMETGAYGEALSLVRQCISVARTQNLLSWQGLGLVLLGTIYRAMLALDEARAAHMEALAFYKQVKIPALMQMVPAELCADCALLGSWEDAHRYALQALATDAYYILLSTRLAHWYETEALVGAGDMELATRDVRYFGERIGTSKRYRIPYLRALAVLAQDRSEIAQAIEHLQEAGQLSEEIGLPGELWPIRAALGELYLKQGDTRKAHENFAQAATIVRTLTDALGNEQQRIKFLASPLVEVVLAQGNQSG